MVKKDVEELYNALKEVKNASIKRKIAQVINLCSRHETLVGIVVGVIVITINFSRVIEKMCCRCCHNVRKKEEEK